LGSGHSPESSSGENNLPEHCIIKSVAPALEPDVVKAALKKSKLGRQPAAAADVP
jgi:hypothetical protein